ncbi:hypothetical protein Taro_035106 [Colocasia esculenta]|uniref:Protein DETOXIFICATION n=1 Tax=Colocasia esculenta TaxID=4460 RepID=A0A843W9J1_COLES|nr:hypothetical protein [Colocasia esculenta]
MECCARCRAVPSTEASPATAAAAARWGGGRSRLRVGARASAEFAVGLAADSQRYFVPGWLISLSCSFVTLVVAAERDFISTVFLSVATFLMEEIILLVLLLAWGSAKFRSSATRRRPTFVTVENEHSDKCEFSSAGTVCGLECPGRKLLFSTRRNHKRISPVSAAEQLEDLAFEGDGSVPLCDLDLSSSEARDDSSLHGELLERPSTDQQAGDFRRELVVLAGPAILGQAVDPLAQLMETAYIGRLGPVELASAGVSVSIFNIISKLFNVPLLSITTSFVAEDISKSTSKKLVSVCLTNVIGVSADKKYLVINGGNEQPSDVTADRERLPSVSSALVLAVGIGTLEALALFCGSGLFLSLMGISAASPMRIPAEHFLRLRALGAPANVVSLAVQGVFRGFKDTTTPLFCVDLQKARTKTRSNMVDRVPTKGSGPCLLPSLEADGEGGYGGGDRVGERDRRHRRAVGSDVCCGRRRGDRCPCVCSWGTGRRGGSPVRCGPYRLAQVVHSCLGRAGSGPGIGNMSAVVLFPVLMYSLRLGVSGAALATVASQYIATFLLLWRLSRRAVLLPPKILELDFSGYIKSGGLLLGRTLSVLFTMTLATSMAARQGPLAMAAHQICLQVWLAVSLLSDALALSAQALIASSYAKGDYERVKGIAYYVLKMGALIGVVLAVILGASFGSLAGLFTKDIEVLQIVSTGMLFVSATQPINALAFIFDGLHYGVSDFSYSAISMMSVGVVSSLVLAYAPPLFGLSGVWFGLTLFMALRMAAGILRLRWETGPWYFLEKGNHTPQAACDIRNDGPLLFCCRLKQQPWFWTLHGKTIISVIKRNLVSTFLLSTL